MVQTKGIVLPDRLRNAILGHALTDDSSDLTITCLSDRSWNNATTLDSADASPALPPKEKYCEPPSPCTSEQCGSEDPSIKARANISRSIKSIRDRYSDSFLYRFLCGSCSRREYDENMSNVVFVSALVITLPFGVFGMFGGGFFDSFEAYIGACLPQHAEEQDGYLFYVQARLVGTIYSQLICALTAFVICACYFVLRPTEPHYKKWLSKGRVGFIVVFALSGYSVLGVSLTASNIVSYFTQNQTLACGAMRDDFDNYLQQRTMRLPASIAAINWTCLSLILLCILLFV